MNRDMLTIQALDSDASLDFSKFTGKWYVSAHVEIGDGAILRSVNEHRNSPEEAISAYMIGLTNIGVDEYLVTTFRGHRREWRWNGAAFAECTRPSVFSAELERAR